MILTSPHRNFINLILVFAFSFGYAENPLLSNYLAKDSKAFPSEIDRQDVTQSPYKELHQMLNKINIGAKDTRFNGTILVGYKGKVIYENAFGNSDRATGLKNTLQTPTQIASITKTFTGTAVA